jgi:DNA-binding transcriptional LysR family regulator
VDNSRKLLSGVERGELDIALVAERPATLPASVSLEHIDVEPLVLVCHPAQHMALAAALKNGQLPRFISYDQPSTTSRLVHEALHRQGITPQAVLYSTSPEVILRLVLLQQGAAALPYSLVREHYETGRMRLLGHPQPWIISRGIASAHLRGHGTPLPLTQLTAQVAHKLSEVMAEAERAAASQRQS